MTPPAAGGAARGSASLSWIVGVLAMCVAGLPGAGDAADPPRAPSPFVYRSITVRGTRYPYALRLPPGYSPARRWPLVVFLHGAGECGSDGRRQTAVGIGPALLAHPGRWPCIVVLPQKPHDYEEWEEHEDAVLAVLREVERTCAVDSARVVLTGLSQGGHGTWFIAARHPDLWSCLVPICGYAHWRTVSYRVARLPVWAFHGLKDDLVNPRDTQRVIEGIQAVQKDRGLPADGPLAPRMTIYPDLNHGAWDTVYADTDVIAWMLAQTRRR